MVRKGSSVRVRWRASSDLPAQAGILISPVAWAATISWAGGAFVGRLRSWLPQLRPAEHAGGEIHATCDISGEQPMPHHPNTPFDDLEPAAVLTAVEVAERIRVDARSVRRAVARGDLTASRACGLRILACDAAEWWRSRTVPATPPPPAESAPVIAPPERSRRAAARRRPEAPARLPLPPRRGDGP